jgi:hypothetical protein
LRQAATHIKSFWCHCGISEREYSIKDSREKVKTVVHKKKKIEILVLKINKSKCLFLIVEKAKRRFSLVKQSRINMIFLKVEIRVLAYLKIGMAVLVPGLTKKLSQGKRKSIFGFRTNYLPRFWPSTIRITGGDMPIGNTCQSGINELL